MGGAAAVAVAAGVLGDRGEAVAGAGAVEEGRAVGGAGVTGSAVGVGAQAAMTKINPQMDAHRHKVPVRIHLGKYFRYVLGLTG